MQANAYAKTKRCCTKASVVVRVTPTVWYIVLQYRTQRSIELLQMLLTA
jgi:hypothetical protein